MNCGDIHATERASPWLGMPTKNRQITSNFIGRGVCLRSWSEQHCTGLRDNPMPTVHKITVTFRNGSETYYLCQNCLNAPGVIGEAYD